MMKNSLSLLILASFPTSDVDYLSNILLASAPCAHNVYIQLCQLKCWSGLLNLIALQVKGLAFARFIMALALDCLLFFLCLDGWILLW